GCIAQPSPVIMLTLAEAKPVRTGPKSFAGIAGIETGGVCAHAGAETALAIAARAGRPYLISIFSKAPLTPLPLPTSQESVKPRNLTTRYGALRIENPQFAQASRPSFPPRARSFRSTGALSR